MVYLVEVNGSHPSQVAMRYAAERCRGPLYLLHVSPSARAAEMESGRRLLEQCRDRCHAVATGIEVRLCLEVGDRVERLAQTAERVAADCVVVGSHDAAEFPHLDPLGETARTAVERMPRPVIVVGQDGALRYDGAAMEAADALLV
jgi:nucleotide-binding universal stress UspA family protein